MGDANAWFYRKDWFAREDLQKEFKAKYGRDLAPPKTQLELKDIAEFFQGRELDGELAGIEARDRPDAAAPRDGGVPGRGEVEAERADAAHPGHDDALAIGACHRSCYAARRSLR